MQRTLLALLLVHANRGISTERLIDALWGEDAPPTAAASLQNQIARLRKLLGPERVHTTEDGYVLELHEGELDADRFEELDVDSAEAESAVRVAMLREALALWRGPAFAGIDELSVRREASRLDDRRLEATEERIDTELALGRHSALTGELEALVSANPLRERLRAQMMLALYRSGRQVEALDQYRDYRRTLADELGLEPSPAMRALEQAILSHDESVATDARAFVRPRVPLAPPAERRRLWPLVVAALAAAALTAFLLLRGGGTELVRANSLAVLDLRDGHVLGSVAVGIGPGAVAAGEDGIWVANVAGESVSRIDPETRRVAETIRLGFAPGAVAVGAGAVWVADPAAGTVAKVLTGRRKPVKLIYLGFGGPGAMPLATGWGSVWVGNENDLTLSRLVAPQGEIVSLIRDAPARAIATTKAGVWMLDARGASVWRVDPVTDTVAAQTSVARDSTALAADERSVWVTDAGENKVWLIDARSGALTKPFPVGQEPRAVALTSHSVWVANSVDGTVTRIDRGTGETRTIRVGQRVAGIAAAADGVWISVTS
jgi:DNA-binding SARP family transcriptional activator/DNA-binding beta-propeller fold protein YncE